LGTKPSSQPSTPELAAALRQPPSEPGRELLSLLRADGILNLAIIGGSIGAAAAIVIMQAALLQALLEIGRQLVAPGARVGALAALIVFSAALLLLEIPIVSALLSLGRRLETRLRLAFLNKIPRLGDRYFQSRLKSDMAERSHNLHLIRRLPELGGQLL